MKIKILFLLMLSCAPVFAQEVPAILSFKDAVKIGLEHNLVLKQTKNNLMAATSERNSSLLQLGPTINAQGNLGSNDGNSFNQQKGVVVNGVVDFMSSGIYANMPLFNGMSNYANYRQFAHQAEAQMQLVRRTNQDVIRNVASQFLNCLLDQKLVLIQEKNVESQRQLYNQIKELVGVGSKAEVDLFNQDYQVKNAELSLLRAKNAMRNNRTILTATLQIDPNLPFSLEEPKWEINVTDFDTQTNEAMTELALAQRSDLSFAVANQKAQQLGYLSRKATYLPSVSAFAQYTSRYNYIRGSEDNRSFNDQFRNDNVQLTYGISFNVPIFGGLQTRARTVRAKINYENAKLTTESAELIVKTTVLLAQQNYKDAKSSFEASSAQLKAAETSHNFEKERYSLGISDIVALTLANQNFTKAQADFENARYTLMFQKIMLNYAVGTLTYEDIP